MRTRRSIAGMVVCALATPAAGPCRVDAAAQVGGIAIAVMQDAVQTNDEFGRRMTTGDFDGDGYDDAAISVDDFNGAVHVIYGSASGLSAVGNQIWRLDSPGILGDGGAGWGAAALASADFNEDGHDDLAVGHTGAVVDGLLGAGAVNVIYGSSTGLTSAGNQRWHQNRPNVEGVAETGDGFGSALAAGDFNGDGLDDLAIGVRNEGLEDLEISDVGAVNVIHGSFGGLTADFGWIWYQGQTDFTGGTIEGTPHAYEYFGHTLAAGDFDGDGHHDLAVGVLRDKENGDSANEGTSGVNVIYGSSTGLRTTRNRLFPFATSGFQVGCILTAADFNGDTRDDLAIGRPATSSGPLLYVGGVLVLVGSSTGLSDSNPYRWGQDSGLLETREPYDWFGAALTAGNYDGDARVDLSVGVPGENGSSGAVSTIYGDSPTFTTVGNQLWYQGRIDPAGSGQILGNREDRDQFGAALASGDFNGDGYADLLVGVQYEAFEGSGGTVDDGGLVQVIYGSSDGLVATGNQIWHQDK